MIARCFSHNVRSASAMSEPPLRSRAAAWLPPLLSAAAAAALFVGTLDQGYIFDVREPARCGARAH
jgi:hypothetical protein